MTTLAGLEITDCHHHLWDLTANYYPWLTDRITTRVCGEYSAIRRNYLLDDFWRDAAEVNLVRSVHVQGEHDENDPVRETRWLQSVADDPASRGFPHGIVAYADFSKDNICSVLEGHTQCSNIRGIRQMLHVAMVDPANPKPSMLENPVWRRNFALIGEFGLSFDLQVYFQQMRQAAELVDEHPSVQFILCHMGQPARRDPDSLRHWRDGLKLLAERPNVAVKISGGGMFDRQWTTESLRPYVLDLIGAFGPERCLFASNFPVDGMMTGYTRLWQAYFDITSGFSDPERCALFSANARRIYRV